MAFEKWQFEANKLSKSEYLMQRALLRMMQLALAKAWSKWHEDYLEAKRLEKVMKGAAKRWRQQKLSKAWNQWRWVAAKMRELLQGFSKEELVQKLADALERIQQLEVCTAESLSATLTLPPLGGRKSGAAAAPGEERALHRVWRHQPHDEAGPLQGLGAVAALVRRGQAPGEDSQGVSFF
jgi:hypothetical protein